MNDRRFSALVVDDEPAVRRLTVGTLSRFNFACDEAMDGDEAGALVCRRKYDVVVTDLRMPKRNGHALAVELLSATGERPLIVILTGVLEPRLASDLMARGVDGVEFKPVNFAAFGAKIRKLCEDRAANQSAAPTAAANGEGAAASSAAPTAGMAPEQLQQRLEALASTLPLAPTAIEVVNMLQRESPNTEAVARRIANDPGLCVELLKLANSAFYNPTGQRVDDLQTAILRLGHRKICETAMASATLQMLSASVLPWVDANLIWQRCLATGQAIECLHPAAAVGGDDESLYLSALLLPMSRVVTGLAAAELYRQMLVQCQTAEASLASQEHIFLATPPEAVLSDFLAHARLSPRIFKPLKHAGSPYSELCQLTDPLRGKVEHLRIAAIVGQLAVRHWMPWDEIEFPTAAVMRRWPELDFGSLVPRIRDELPRLAGEARPANAQAYESSTLVEPRKIRYFKLTVEPHDFLAPMAEALGMHPVSVSRAAACEAGPVLVNCLDVSEERLVEFLETCQPESRRILVENGSRTIGHSSRGTFVGLPCSFGHFAKALSAIADQPCGP